MTFHLAVVDEAGFAGQTLSVIFPVTADENSKVICTTSVNSKEEKSCLLYNLAKIDMYPIYVMSLACDKHLEMIAITEQASVCPCFILFAPSARSGDPVLKKTMNLLYKNSYTEELLGGGTSPRMKNASSSSAFVAFEAFEFDTRVDTTEMASQDSCLVAYIDTAFSDSEQASKVGMAIVSTFTNKIVLLGIDEYCHEMCSTEAIENIAKVFVELLVKICTIHKKSVFKNVYIILERNYANVFCFPLAQAISFLVQRKLPSLLSAKFLYSKVRDDVFKVGYNLGYEKLTIFKNVASIFNDGLLACAAVLISNNIQNPMHYLIHQLQVLNAPKNKKKHDDVALSVVMAAHFLLNIHNASFANGELYAYRALS